MRASGFRQPLALAFVFGSEIERAGAQTVHGRRHLIPVAGGRAARVDEIEPGGVDGGEIVVFGVKLLAKDHLHQLGWLTGCDQVAGDDDAIWLEPPVRGGQTALESARNGVAQSAAQSEDEIEIARRIGVDCLRSGNRLKVDLLRQLAIVGQLSTKREIGRIVIETVDRCAERFGDIDRGRPDAALHVEHACALRYPGDERIRDQRATTAGRLIEVVRRKLGEDLFE